jgi:phosphoglycerate dehydrogenase-like enzyme
LYPESCEVSTVTAGKRQIHIQNPPATPGALRLEPEHLELALAGRGLRSKFTISAGEGEKRLPDAAREAEILFLLTKAPLDDARAVAPKLKWVQTAYAGMEKTVPYLPKGLLVSNASGVHAEKGAEYILMAALMLNSAIPQFIENKSDAAWAPVYTPALRTKRVTILGVGAIGGAAAVLLKRIGCVVWGVTRSGEAMVDLDAVVDVSGIDELLPKTDILVSTLPDTADSDGLIDRSRIDALPYGAGVISVGRAPALDYDAIIGRLRAGSLSGAVLDVFPKEPIPRNSRIWRTPRLIVTPHCGIDDHSTYIDRCLDVFLDNLERELAGERLRNLVDPSQGY